MENNILYSFAQRFKRDNDLESIKSLILYTSQIATNYNTPLDEMYFGGTEKEILNRHFFEIVLFRTIFLNDILYLSNDKED